MFAVVVHEHVLADAEQGGRVDLQGCRYRHLESSHVPWISSILQAVLVALQEEFQLKPEHSE